MKYIPIALGLAILCAACGGSSGPVATDADNAHAVAQTFAQQLFKGDIDQAYNLVDSGSKAICPKPTFAAIASFARTVTASLAGQPVGFKQIRAVSVDGATATASIIYDVEGFSPQELHLVKQGGNWRVKLASNCDFA